MFSNAKPNSKLHDKSYELQQQQQQQQQQPHQEPDATFDEAHDHDERQKFLFADEPIEATKSSHFKRSKVAKLARQETIDEEQQEETKDERRRAGCCRMLCRFINKKKILVPLIILLCLAAIYCVPFVEIDAEELRPLPAIPFNYREGPLRASSLSSFRVEHLFKDQVNGPESLAFDSAGNVYMAIDGGFILYAHLNSSSPVKWSYYGDTSPSLGQDNRQASRRLGQVGGELVKIAELNGIKQMPYDPSQRRRTRDGRHMEAGAWRRECQLDEKIYGSPDQQVASAEKFHSNIRLSRCSRPLGVRLSPDESYLYVVDTLSGLYRVSLRVAERPNSSQRLVTRLVDFKANNQRQMLPVAQLDLPLSQQALAAEAAPPTVRARAYLNISLMAVDDLVIDYGAGTRGGDLIYMTDASQDWPALSFFYDLLEGRPSGVILRYDTGANLLNVLDPQRVAHVRTSATLELGAPMPSKAADLDGLAGEQPDLGLGAPRLDENDVFDDRPLHFPNGIELTDDKQALLIADTSNKRIVKHYIRGPRRGTSDLWAWTPNFPDNIRRGHDKRVETYWVVGCGQDASDHKLPDVLDLVRAWPSVRKFILKNIYLFGWCIEQLGARLFRSTSVRDFGYSVKIGHLFCEKGCPGMMILQYNGRGDLIRSIHSREFPSDLSYYSQVNEIIDAKNQEHVLYLSSPSYRYVTKLILPTDSLDSPPASNQNESR